MAVSLMGVCKSNSKRSQVLRNGHLCPQNHPRGNGGGDEILGLWAETPNFCNFGRHLPCEPTSEQLPRADRPGLAKLNSFRRTPIPRPAGLGRNRPPTSGQDLSHADVNNLSDTCLTTDARLHGDFSWWTRSLRGSPYQKPNDEKARRLTSKAWLNDRVMPR